MHFIYFVALIESHTHWFLIFLCWKAPLFSDPVSTYRRHNEMLVRPLPTPAEYWCNCKFGNASMEPWGCHRKSQRHVTNTLPIILWKCGGIYHSCCGVNWWILKMLSMWQLVRREKMRFFICWQLQKYHCIWSPSC